jgi:hypothetical protein
MVWSDGEVDGEVPEPIEVELTSHAPQPDRGGRWRREPVPVGGPEPRANTDGAADRPSDPRSDRTRLVLVASVAAVLALALGWMLGRATSGESETTTGETSDRTRATTTVETPPATLPIVGEEIDGADFEEPEGSVVSGPTTTEAVEPTVEPIAVDARLAGLPVRLVGVELGGQLVEVDLASGTLTDFRANRLVSNGNPLAIGPDWVASTASNGRVRLIRSDGTDTTVDLGGDYWRLLQVPGTELFWRGSGGVLELVDLGGEPVGRTIELPLNSWPYLVDPASGGVVIFAASRSYVVTPDAVEQLATGEIIGMNDQIVVTYDCDEVLVCSLYRTDRATGEAVAVPPDPGLDEPYQWGSMAGWGGAEPGTLSPDGRWVAVIGSSWRAAVAGIVELESGRFVELSQLSSPPTVAWSPDGRWAFTLDGQAVAAYDTSTGERFPVFTDGVQWIQLGARPLVVESPDVGSEGGTLLSAAPEEPVEG